MPRDPDIPCHQEETVLARKYISVGHAHYGSQDDVMAHEHQVWQEVTISGILHHASSFGSGWWYRIQPADEVILSSVLDVMEAPGKSLRDHATSCFPLPKDSCYVAWSPQWVPAKSISQVLRKAFWAKMPPRFWNLSRSLGEDVIWREEVEQLVSLSHNGAEHLCTRKGCTKCAAERICGLLVDAMSPDEYVHPCLSPSADQSTSVVDSLLLCTNTHPPIGN
jgi:hypothetical protein